MVSTWASFTILAKVVAFSNVKKSYGISFCYKKTFLRRWEWWFQDFEFLKTAKFARTFTHWSLRPDVSDLRGGSLRTTGRTRAATAAAGRTGAAARTCRWCRRRTWRRQSSSFVCKCPRLAFFSAHATVTRTANLSLLWHCGLFCMNLSQKMRPSKSVKSEQILMFCILQPSF